MARQVTCPACSGQFETQKDSGTVFCVECGNRVTLDATGAADASPSPAAPADAPAQPAAGMSASEISLLDYAASVLSADLNSPVFDLNIQKAEGWYKDVLLLNQKNPQAWKGLFDCLLLQTRKTFVSLPRIEGTDYWLTTSGSPHLLSFNVDSYFCRVMVLEDNVQAMLLDEVLQPGRKAKKFLDSAIECADPPLKEEYERLADEYFEKPRREMPGAGKVAFLAWQQQERNNPGRGQKPPRKRW